MVPHQAFTVELLGFIHLLFTEYPHDAITQSLPSFLKKPNQTKPGVLLSFLRLQKERKSGAISTSGYTFSVPLHVFLKGWDFD